MTWTCKSAKTKKCEQLNCNVFDAGIVEQNHGFVT